MLRQTHSHYNHCGAQKLLQAMLRSAWWPGISADYQRHVRMCLVCQRFGRDYPHSAHHPLVKDAPMQVVSINVIGPLDRTRIGYKYICSLVDAHTRYAEMQPTSSCDANTAIAILQDIRMPHWGVPQILLANAATTFGSHRWLNFCK